jgi:asparagine synthase (glutamine-hydrolysing)
MRGIVGIFDTRAPRDVPGPLRERLSGAILCSALPDTGFLDAAFLEGLVREHQSGLRDYSAPLWSLLMFEAFLRHVAGVPSSRPRDHRYAAAETVAE